MLRMRIFVTRMDLNCVHKTIHMLALLEFLLSIGVTVCGALDFVMKSYLSNVGHGIWGGVWLCITAICGLISGRNHATGMHAAHLVFAIISVVLMTPIVITIFLFEITKNTVDNPYSTYFAHCWNCTSCANYCSMNSPIIVSQKIAIIFCMMLFVVFLFSIAFTCCAVCVCCGGNPNREAIYPINDGNNLVLIPNPNTTKQWYTNGYTAPVNPNCFSMYHPKTYEPCLPVSPKIE